MGDYKKGKEGVGWGHGGEWDEEGDYLVSINHLYGWVGLAGIKKLFVGHIRGIEMSM